jgi:dihydroorotate dehydrogenase
MSLLPYALLRPLLFRMEPEAVHDVTLNLLAATQHTPLRFAYQQPRIADPVQLAGLTFPNRIGLAAGLDKNARCIDAFAAMGFGFVEVGTVTPVAQSGNPMPRMFRLPQAQALINRLGFNNQGLESFLRNVQLARFRQASPPSMLLGLNIGKNAVTPIEHAADDYLICLKAVYPFADYVTVNISSPNTQNLRSLQSDAALSSLLSLLDEARMQLAQAHDKQVPLFIKVAPDLNDSQLEQLCATLHSHVESRGGAIQDAKWGVIATNTTLSREAVATLPYGSEAGGLSGVPVKEASNRVIRALRQRLGPDFPIIGVGGVFSADDAIEKIQAGANLVQIYTGLIYQGPALVTQIAKGLRDHAI